MKTFTLKPFNNEEYTKIFRMKFSCVLFSLWLFFHGINVEGVTVYPPNLGGGLDGTNGDKFLTGTADTPKLEVGVQCTKTTSTSTDVELSIHVYQKDTAFKYSNIGPDDGKFVEYDTCFLIDAEEYAEKDDIVEATSLANCGDTAKLTLVDDTNPMDTGFETRTFTTKVSFDYTNEPFGCGGYDDSTKILFAVVCKRNVDYDKAFDYVFVIEYYDMENKCFARQLDTSFTVSDPPIINHREEMEVTFKAYKNKNIASIPWPDGPQSTDGAHSNDIEDIGTNAVKLGDAIYFEICLINNAVSTTSPYNQFFPDGIGPIGIYVKRCTASNDAVPGTATSNANPTKEIIKDGCGKGVTPTEMIGTTGFNGRGFMYVKDTIDPVKDWLRTPNCFRSPPTPAVSYARISGADEAVTVYQCEIEYCLSSDDTRCFGDKTLEQQGYPSCTRKKRETSTTKLDPRIYPKTVSLAVRVAMTDPNTANSEICQETTMLVSVSAILSIVLLLVLIVAGLMTYSLQSLAHANDDTSSSMAGIVPKFYF